MPAFFHQNMRNFGGGAGARNVQYAAGFGAMAAGVGAVAAAGFTEITNPNAPLRAQLLLLSQLLNVNVTNIIVAQVGTTALGLVEYIGMTWDPAQFAVSHGGMVVYDNLTRRWTTYCTPAPFAAPPVLTIPGAPFTAVDSRGPAFLAGVIGGNNLVIMFMHNMYNLGDRSSGFSGLQSCAQSIIANLPGAFAAANVCVGGDYNVLPRDLRKRRGNMPLLSFRAGRVGAVAGGALINTTLANCYDYWLLRNPGALAPANFQVFVQTRVPLCSDHAGIRALI